MVNKSETKDLAIRVHHIKKNFHLPHEKSSRSLKSIIVNMFRKKDRSADIQHALKDISFDVEKGDFFGIVGRNGSGKSTLLKIIAQIYQPTSGKVEHYGKLVPFIELGVGFNPELSGRENVYLNGALLGFTREEIEAKYDDIVEFAELDGFMDQKLKNYSSGMQVRLAFSVATRAEADILVLDEVLAVGDEAFQRKCNNYFEKIRKSGRTVILVTHNMEDVRKYCNKAMLIQDGLIRMIGNPDKIADEYYGINLTQDSKKQGVDERKPELSARIIGDPVFNNTDTIEVEVKYRSLDSRQVYPKVVLNYNNVPIMAANAKVLYGITTSDTKEHLVQYRLPLNEFNKGEVSVVALLVDSKEEANIADFGYENELPFIVKNVKTGNKIGGIMRDLGVMVLKR